MQFKHVIPNPGTLCGKPILKGSRISVQLVLEWMASGATIPDILQKYPHRSEAAIREASHYLTFA